MANRGSFLSIIVLYTGWVLFLLLITFLGLSYLPSIARPELELVNPNPKLEYFHRWANWDGAHFISIAQNGYEPYQVVFFPLYPLLIKLLTFFKLDFFWSGFLISLLSTAISLFYFYKLVLLDFKKEHADKTIFYFLIFPTSFFLITVYSESLFLALTLSSFYYARRNNFLLASTLSGLSALTRVIGIFVVIAIWIEYYISKKGRLNTSQILESKIFRFLSLAILANIFFYLIGQESQIFYLMFLFMLVFITIFLLVILLLKIKKDFLYFIFSIAPFLVFSYFLNLTQNHPLAFVYYETHWGRKFSLPWEILFSDISSLYQSGFFQISTTHQKLTEFIFALIFIGGFFGSFKNLRISYRFFYGASLILPLLTGTLLSIQRFGLILFPLFIILAGIRNNLFEKLWIIISILLLGLFSILYINNYWVA